LEAAKIGAQEAEPALAKIAELEQEAVDDPALQEEIAAIKQEAQAKKQAPEGLQARLTEINAKLAAIEGGEASPAVETSVEAVASVEASPAVEAPVETAVAETPVEAPAEAVVAEAPAAVEAPVEAVAAETPTTVEAPTAEAKPEAPAEVVRGAKEEVALPNFDNMDLKQATGKMNDELAGAGDEAEKWYSKMLSGGGTIADAEFAQDQLNQLKNAQEHLGQVGAAYIDKRKKEGKTTSKAEEVIAAKQAKLASLASKIEDRVILTSENIHEDEVYKKMHPETVQEDLDLAREKISSTYANAKETAHKYFLTGIAGGERHVNQLKDASSKIAQAIDDYTKKIDLLKVLSNTADASRKTQFRSMLIETEDFLEDLTTTNRQLEQVIRKSE
jgi:hypothetical protein